MISGTETATFSADDLGARACGGVVGVCKDREVVNLDFKMCTVHLMRLGSVCARNCSGDVP